jgi:hypothetical protein
MSTEKVLIVAFICFGYKCKKPCKSVLTGLCIVLLFISAEREGFEPPEAHTSTVFKTAAIDHSAISPHSWVFPECECKSKYLFEISKGV